MATGIMSNLNVRIHPVVLFNIVDAYERRQGHQHRVIGTLLGTTDKSGVVEITNSFVVQHRETEQEVAIDIEVAKELYELYRKVNVNESIVGWFATGEGDVNEYSVLIHEYYTRETPNPVHVTVTPSKNGVSVKAYVSTPFGVPGKTKGTMFSPVPCLSKGGGYEQELVGLKACMASAGIDKTRPQTFETELEMLLSASHQCTDNIAVLIKFIDECILTAGSPGGPSTALSAVNSNEIGRQLMSMVEGLSPFGDDDEQLNTNLKDLLMVIYLSNLTKTQLMLNEKLSLL